MAVTLTTEQILALSPDASSTKSGRELANPRKWVSLGCDENSAWGECQGSGAKPYQTQIDLSEPAFRCSCPSRKFPCKHSLGLFLLLAQDRKAFTQDTPPDWVTDWLAGRTRREEQRARKAEAPEKPVDAAAQAKRTAQREEKVAAGLEDLERRLCDLVRRGLASAQGEPPAFWEEIAKRMVDAQAGGLAGAVREMASLPASGPGWQERLLDRMARCYLLLQGHRHLEALPPETQADIRSLIGWTQSQEELLAQPGVRDRWTVLGQYIEEDERLRVQRIWLCGRDSGMAALLLNFVIPGQTFDTTLPTGAALDASLVFYPGGYPLRALMKERHSPIAPRDAMPGYPSVVAAVDAYAAALARSPWLDRFPMAFHQVVPLCQGDRWLLRDDDGRLLPLAPRFSSGWNLLAVSGGYPVALFGEWNGEHLHPLSACANGVFHAL